MASYVEQQHVGDFDLSGNDAQGTTRIPVDRYNDALLLLRVTESNATSISIQVLTVDDEGHEYKLGAPWMESLTPSSTGNFTRQLTNFGERLTFDITLAGTSATAKVSLKVLGKIR